MNGGVGEMLLRSLRPYSLTVMWRLCAVIQFVHIADVGDAVIKVPSQLKGEDAATVRAILGPPPIMFRIGPEEMIWSYPVRLPHRGRVWERAALLRVNLDKSDRVESWGFFHPILMTPLTISETVENADRFRQNMQRTTCAEIRRIELANVLKIGNRVEDVLDGMRWFKGPTSTAMESTFVTRTIEMTKHVLTFYADHPSPLFLPCFSFEVQLSRSRQRVNMTWIEGWGGCK